MEEKPVETPTEEKIVAKSVEEQPIAKREGLDRTVSVTVPIFSMGCTQSP